MSKAFVIGSGHAGVACATALLARGQQVVMLDAGISLDLPNSLAVDRLRSVKPELWSDDDLQVIKKGMQANAAGIPLKASFGSDFPFRDAVSHLNCDLQGTRLLPSFAKGGLSNVWGGAVLPYSATDITDWPFGISRLESHYRAALELTGQTGLRDDLDPIFPISPDVLGTLKLSRQAQLLRSNAEGVREHLREQGMFFGASRLAVRGSSDPRGGCIHCGTCIYGCPYGYIYSSTQTLADLLESPGFEYRPNSVVDTLSEEGDKVRIKGHERVTSEALEFEAGRVFLASGVIPTAKIMLESLGVYGRALPILDSQCFLFPLLLAKGVPMVREEALHALTQLFIEMSDPKISSNLIHLQVYSYSEVIGDAFKKTLGILGKWDTLLRELEGRLMIVQGFLHSNDSAQMSATLHTGTPSKLVISSEFSKRPIGIIHRVVGKFLLESVRLGAFPILPMLKPGVPGQSFHCGGTFPMRRSPKEFESDELGRPVGFNRVHLVDASCFPSVPATTIALSAMANAHRIGWEASDLA